MFIRRKKLITMKTYICNKQRTPDNVQIPKRKKFSKLDSHPELRILSELAGVRNLLLPNIIKTQ